MYFPRVSRGGFRIFLEWCKMPQAFSYAEGICSYAFLPGGSKRVSAHTEGVC